MLHYTLRHGAMGVGDVGQSIVAGQGKCQVGPHVLLIGNDISLCYGEKGVV